MSPNRGKFIKIIGMLSPGISVHLPRALVVMSLGPEHWANMSLDCMVGLEDTS